MDGDDGMKFKDSFMCFEVCDWGSPVLMGKVINFISETGRKGASCPTLSRGKPPDWPYRDLLRSSFSKNCP
jgi:hypothetical protein